MTRTRMFQTASCSFIVLILAGIVVFVAVSLRNFVAPPPQIYEGKSIPLEYSHYFDRHGIPPTATEVRVYYDPSLRGGYWLRARLQQDELASFRSGHEHIDKAATLPSSPAEWIPESVAAWWPKTKTDDMTVFQYSSSWFVIIDREQRFVYVMHTDD